MMLDQTEIPAASSFADARWRLAPGERWFVVQAIPRREANALFQLEQQGFRAFLPVVMRTVRHARKVRAVKVAAFPGYLFVSLDLQRDRWRSVNGTFGVSRLIMGNAHPLAVPAGIVESLLDYRDESGVCRFERDLVAGQLVRIVSGPLAETLGKLIHLNDNGRVRVLLEILGGAVQVSMDKAALAAA
jgi:transcriptional antiterminator RfaH